MVQRVLIGMTTEKMRSWGVAPVADADTEEVEMGKGRKGAMAMNRAVMKQVGRNREALWGEVGRSWAEEYECHQHSEEQSACLAPSQTDRECEIEWCVPRLRLGWESGEAQRIAK